MKQRPDARTFSACGSCWGGIVRGSAVREMSECKRAPEVTSLLCWTCCWQQLGVAMGRCCMRTAVDSLRENAAAAGLPWVLAIDAIGFCFGSTTVVESDEVRPRVERMAVELGGELKKRRVRARVRGPRAEGHRGGA